MIKKVIVVIIVIFISSSIIMAKNPQIKKGLNPKQISENNDTLLNITDLDYTDIEIDRIICPYDNELKITELEYSDINISRISFPYEIEGIYSSVLTYESIASEANEMFLRKNGDIYYGIIKIKSTDDRTIYIFMLFDSYLNFKDGMTVQKITNKKDYENIQIGATTFEEIIKIDSGVILLENESYNDDIPNAVSFHRFTDDTMMKIDYIKVAEKWIVKDISIKEDPMKFLDSLLTKDLEQIT